MLIYWVTVLCWKSINITHTFAEIMGIFWKSGLSCLEITFDANCYYTEIESESVSTVSVRVCVVLADAAGGWTLYEYRR